MSKENKKDTTGWKNEDFLQMCNWVERELMGYSGTQRLHKNACLRLQGLRKGQSMANNSHEMYGEYPIDVIFNTFLVADISNCSFGKNKIGFTGDF